jgi:glucose-6-phosphate isomerase
MNTKFLSRELSGIFSASDKYGVELGKQLANKILPELQTEDKIETHDSSTNSLINIYKEMRKGRLK